MEKQDGEIMDFNDKSKYDKNKEIIKKDAGTDLLIDANNLGVDEFIDKYFKENKIPKR